MPSVLDKYGLSELKTGHKPHILDKYGLSELKTNILSGAYESIIGRGLRKAGIVPELAPEDRPVPTTLGQKVTTGAGQLLTDLPFYLASGGLATGAGAGPILSSAASFGVPGAIRETLGEAPTLGSIAKETAKEATLGGVLGVIGQLPVGRILPKKTPAKLKPVAEEAIKFPLETTAFAEAQALERGEVVPSKEEFLTSGIFLGGLKGFNAALRLVSRQTGKPEAQVKQEIKDEAQATGKSEKEILANKVRGLTPEEREIINRQPTTESFGDISLEKEFNKSITELDEAVKRFKEKGAGRVSTQVPLKEEEIAETPPQASEVVKPISQQAITEQPSKAGEAPLKEPTLSGGRPGEFTPEEADAFRRMEIAQTEAQRAMQSGDKATFDKFNDEIKNISGELSELRAVEGRFFEPKSKEKIGALKTLSAKFPKQPIPIEESLRMAEEMSPEKARHIMEEVSKGQFSAATLKYFQALNDGGQIFGDLQKLPKSKLLSDADIVKASEKLMASLSDIMQVAKPGSSEAGRALRVHQVMIQLTKNLESLSINDTAKWREVIDRIQAIEPGDFTSFMKFVRQIPNPSFMDYVYEWYYSSILSGFLTTHVINVVNTAYWVGFQMPLGALRGLVDIPVSKFQGRPREFFSSEIRSEWAGAKVGFKRGIAKVFHHILTGKMPDELTKWQREMRIGAFERSPSPVLRTIGKYVTIPGKALTLEDAIFRSTAYEMKIYGLARREALKALNAGKIKEIDVPKSIARLLENPTEKMILEAGKFMDDATFNNAPNIVARAFLQLREAIPGARFLLPFINTISSLFEKGLALTPGIGVAIRGKAGLQGPELSTTLTSQLIGGLVTTYVVTKYLDGEITGALPADKAEREAWYRQGKLPWAAQWGDDYYSWARLEPFNTAISAVTSVLDAWAEHGEEPSPELIGHLFVGMGRRLLDASYLSQFSDFITSVERGERGVEALKKMAQRQTAAMLIPYSSFIRSIQRGLEGAERGEVVVRQPQGVGEQLKSQIPFLAEEVPARREVFGEPATIPGGAFRQLFPWKRSEETKDPTELELKRLKIPIGMPSKKLKGIELERDDYDALVRQEGVALKMVLDRIISAPGWAGIPDVFKRILLERAVNQVREPMSEAFFLKLATEKPDYIREQAQKVTRRGGRLPIPLTPLGIQ